MKTMTALVATTVCLYLPTAMASHSWVDTLVFDVAPKQTTTLAVLEAPSGKVCFERNGHQLMQPASITKAFTAYAAYQVLGADFRFETSMSLAPVDSLGHTPQVTLQFSGDPSFTSDTLTQWVQTLKQQGVTTINALSVDDTLYPVDDRYPRGNVVDDLPWYYSAPTQAIVIDKNRIAVTLEPADALGGQVTVRTQHPLLNIRDEVVSVSKEAANYCNLNASLHGTEAKLTGCWPHRLEPSRQRLAQISPRQYLVAHLEAAFRDYQITLKEPITFKPLATADRDTHQVWRHHSEPLSALLVDVMSHSSNVYSQQIFKQLAVKKGLTPTFQNAAKVMREVLVDVAGLDETAFELNDGAGMSTYNLVSAMEVAKLFRVMSLEPNLSHLLQQTGAQYGAEGTLKERAIHLPPTAWFVGKTGGASRIKGLGGVLYHQAQPTRIIVTMTNGLLDNRRDIIAMEDKLIERFSNEALEGL